MDYTIYYIFLYKNGASLKIFYSIYTIYIFINICEDLYEDIILHNRLLDK